jgi:hypothetical protein
MARLDISSAPSMKRDHVNLGRPSEPCAAQSSWEIDNEAAIGSLGFAKIEPALCGKMGALGQKWPRGNSDKDSDKRQRQAIAALANYQGLRDPDERWPPRGNASVGGLLEPSKSRSALATGRPYCVIERRTELTRRRMSHTAGPRTCKGAALATPQRIGADDKSGPASHLTLNRLAGVLTQCARSRFRQLRLALLPMCSTF